MATRRAVTLGLMLFLPNAGLAQARWLPRVQLDNDAYDFWILPGDRSDDQYTNGVKFSLESGGAPWWGSRFAPGRRGCADGGTAGATCLATVITLGQDLYTPNLDRAPFTVTGWQNERPYFAWLYLSGEARAIRPRTLRTFTLSLGVTGPPAEGELAQKTFHAFAPHFTRTANGWETQIGFEPGVVGTWRESVLVAHAGDRQGVGFDLAPSLGASLGNVLTNATAGSELRVGWNLSHPWDPRTWAGRRPLELWASLGGGAEYVARDMSLDGTLVHPTRKVERIPGVTTYDVGLGVRVHWLSLSYQATTRSREYRTGPVHHAFSSMIGEIAW